MASDGGSVQWRGASRQVVSSNGTGAQADDRLYSLRSQKLIVQSGRDRVARTGGADRQAGGHSGTPALQGAGAGTDVAIWSRLEA